MRNVWQSISLYLLFWRQSNMYFSVHFFLALGLTEWFSDSRDERNSALNHSRRLWRDKTFAASISLMCKLHIFERAITWKKKSNQLNVNPSAKKNDSTIMSALKNGRKQLTVNPSAKKNGRKWLTVNPSRRKNGWTKTVNRKKITEKKGYHNFYILRLKNYNFVG